MMTPNLWSGHKQRRTWTADLMAKLAAKKAGTRNQGSSHPAPATVDAWQDNFVEVLNAVGDTFEA